MGDNKYNTPWKIFSDSWGIVRRIYDRSDKVIYSPSGDAGSMFSPEPYSGDNLSSQNAQHIVSCVNNLPKAIEIIEALTRELENIYNDYKDCKPERFEFEDRYNEDDYAMIGDGSGVAILQACRGTKYKAQSFLTSMQQKDK